MLLTVVVAACGTLHGASDDPTGGDAGQPPADSGGAGDDGSVAPPIADAGSEGGPHHIHASFDEPDAALPFGWQTTVPATEVPPEFLVDTTERLSLPNSFRVKTGIGRDDRYFSQDLGDAITFTLSTNIYSGVHTQPGAIGARLVDISCDQSVGVYVHYTNVETVRLAETGGSNSTAAIALPPTQWVSLAVTFTNTQATVTIGGKSVLLTLSKPCTYPHLRVGVLPSGADATGYVRYDDLDLVWVTR